MIANKRIDDFGEKIGRARKDFRYQMVSEAEIQEMSEIERLTHIVKSAIWPAPDYAELVKSGVPIGVAYAIKLLRDGLPPSLSARVVKRVQDFGGGECSAFEKYAASIAFVRDAVAGARTVDEIQEAREKILTHLRSLSRVDLFCSGLREVSFNRAINGTGRWVWSSMEAMAVSRNWPEGMKPAVRFRRRYLSLLGGDTQGPYRFGMGRWYPPKGAAQDFVRSLQSSTFSTIQEAEEAVRQRIETFLREQRSMQVNPEARPQLAHLERTGLCDRRKGRNVTEEDIQKTFAFRAGEFGNWMSQDDRRQTLNWAFDALWDLADVLGVKPEAISLNGTLAIAFGSRGVGKAAAHYEVGRKVINLTKPSGAGCLAHEWWHAIDHHMGTLAGAPDIMKPFLMQMTDDKDWIQAGKHPKEIGEIADKLGKLLHVHKWDKLSASEGAKFWRSKVDHNNRCTMSFFEDWQKMAVQPDCHPSLAKGIGNVIGAIMNDEWDTELLRQTIREVNKMVPRSAAISARSLKAIEGNLLCKRRHIDSLNAVARGDHVSVQKTALWTHLSGLDAKRAKPYFSTAIEVGARSFEAFIADELLRQGARSDYLVFGVESEIYPSGKTREEAGDIWKKIVIQMQEIYGKREVIAEPVQDKQARPVKGRKPLGDSADIALFSELDDLIRDLGCGQDGQARMKTARPSRVKGR